jgi:O-antigen ligase
MQQDPSALTQLEMRRSRALFDLLGLGLVGAAIVWTCLAAADRPTHILPIVLVMLACVGAYVAGRLVGVPHPIALPAAVACVIALTLGARPPTSLGTAAAGPPLGYGNANGALGVAGILAAVIAAVAATHTNTRRALYGVGGLILLETALTRSLAATLLAVSVLGVGLVAPVVRGRRLLAAVGVLAVVGSVTITTFIGLRYQPEHRPPESVVVAQDVLSGRRVQLWHDAITMVTEDPVRGVGPGRFAVESPTAQADPDARWAHSTPLQLAAEQGVPGVVLIAALLGWAFASLLRSSRPDPVVACALAGLTAFALQASVDYTPYFPAIPVIVALLVGVATAAYPGGAHART